MIDVHVEYEHIADAFAVTIYSRVAGGIIIHRPDEQGWIRPDFETTPDNVQVEPSLHLPRQVVEALVEKATGKLRPSDATLDALTDAREVRDRLLTLVEEGWRG